VFFAPSSSKSRSQWMWTEAADTIDAQRPHANGSRASFTSPNTPRKKPSAAFDESFPRAAREGNCRGRTRSREVKLRSDPLFNARKGEWFPYGRVSVLMHYLACFTLFDGDPDRVTTILDGFLAVTPRRCKPPRGNISFPQPRHRRTSACSAGCGPMTAASVTPKPSRWLQLWVPNGQSPWPKRTVRTLPNGMQVVLAEIARLS